MKLVNLDHASQEMVKSSGKFKRVIQPAVREKLLY
jgi:hypothetical protein